MKIRRNQKDLNEEDNDKKESFVEGLE